MYVIYVIKKDDRILYVGKSINFLRRKYEHTYRRKLDKTYIFETLESGLAKEEAKKLEEKYIEFYDSVANGWNKTSGEGTRDVKSKDGDGRFQQGNNLCELRVKKRVLHIDSGIEYNSARECAEVLDIPSIHVNKVCGGQRKSYKKLHFKYI